MAYDPSLPANGSQIVAAELRAQFQALHDEISTAVTGPPGPPGPDGPSGPPFAEVQVDSVTTVAPGSPANVTQNFDGSIVHLFFDIPQGVPGEVAQTDLDAAINTTALNPVSVPALPPGATLAEVVAAFNELRGALLRV